MSTPYELLTGLALLREKKRLADMSGERNLESWSALVAKLGDEMCVLRQDDVEEILHQEKLTFVSGVAPWVSGLSFFRGRLLNVLDGKRLFNCPQQKRPNPAAARIMVVQGDEEWFGLKVDEVIGIRHVWSDNVDSFSALESGGWLGLVEQWLRIEDNMVPVLQLKKLMRVLEHSGRPEPEGQRVAGIME